MSKLTFSKSNTAGVLAGALVAVGAYITHWDAPAQIVASATVLVSALLSLVVKD